MHNGAEPVSGPNMREPLAVSREEPGVGKFSTQTEEVRHEGKIYMCRWVHKTYLPQYLPLAHKVACHSHPHSPMTQKSWEAALV